MFDSGRNALTGNARANRGLFMRVSLRDVRLVPSRFYGEKFLCNLRGESFMFDLGCFCLFKI